MSCQSLSLGLKFVFTIYSLLYIYYIYTHTHHRVYVYIVSILGNFRSSHKNKHMYVRFMMLQNIKRNKFFLFILCFIIYGENV